MKIRIDNVIEEGKHCAAIDYSILDDSGNVVLRKRSHVIGTQSVARDAKKYIEDTIKAWGNQYKDQDGSKISRESLKFKNKEFDI